MNVAASPGAHICASAQIYPYSKPAEVPPRPAWTGADPRVMKKRYMILYPHGWAERKTQVKATSLLKKVIKNKMDSYLLIQTHVDPGISLGGSKSE